MARDAGEAEKEHRKRQHAGISVHINDEGLLGRAVHARRCVALALPLIAAHVRSVGAYAVDLMRGTIGLGMIPSDDTLRAHITTIVGEPLLESGFTYKRLDFALEHFQRVGYNSNAFLLVNDATALLPAIGYRAVDDSVHGYAIPDEQLAQIDVRAGESLEEFMQRFHSHPLANQVEVYLLVPLAPCYPPYILAAFAQSGSQSTETISRRLVIAREEMERRGALIIGWAADGASSHFKLMRQLRSASPGAPTITIAGIPTLKGELSTEKLPARIATYKGKEFLLPTTPILDPVHLLNLLRNSALRKGFAGRVGDSTISLARVRDYLEQRLGQFGMEEELGVRYTDFAVEDRMNFAAAQRAFSTSVVCFLEKHASAELKGMYSYFFFLESDPLSRGGVLLSALQRCASLLPGPCARTSPAHRGGVPGAVHAGGLVHATQGGR